MSQPLREQPRWSSPCTIRQPPPLLTPDTHTEHPTRHVTIDIDKRPAVACYKVHSLLSDKDQLASHLTNSASNPCFKQGGDVRRWTRDAPAPPSTADGRRSPHCKRPMSLPKLAAADLARSASLPSPAVQRGWACHIPPQRTVPHAEPHMMWRSPLLEAEVELQAASTSEAELHASSREERCMLAVQPLGMEPNLNLLLPLLLPLPLLMPLPLPLSRTTPEPTSVAAPRHARFAAVALPAGARAVHRGTPPVRLRTR